MGPMVSSDQLSKPVACKLMRPNVTFKPVRPLKALGMRTDPPVSLPMATGAKPAATAAALGGDGSLAAELDRIRTVLNGEVMQDWSTDDMIFDVPAIIAFLSASKTLLPGTVILTGTPHGVGFARNPPVWLKSGDTVTIEIEKIGALTNPVVDEKV